MAAEQPDQHPNDAPGKAQEDGVGKNYGEQHRPSPYADPVEWATVAQRLCLELRSESAEGHGTKGILPDGGLAERGR